MSAVGKGKAGFVLTDGAQRRLHALSFALGVTKSQIVESGIDQVVAKLPAKDRAAFDAAAKAMEANGQ
jgi:hypothetical protein